MKQNCEFHEAAITVYCGENARINTQESLKQAFGIVDSGNGNVLFVNTVFSTRKLYELARRICGSVEHDGLHYRQVVMGDLHKYFSEFQELITAENIKTIVINSWEFSNKNYTYKEKALFQLKHYADALGVTVLVYSQAKYACNSGKIAHGGLGKLAVIADEIINIHTNEIEKQERESAISSTRKINNLTYARSDSGVSADGELIQRDKKTVVEEFSSRELMEV